MSIKQSIDQDLKNAMLAGDKQKVEALRGLKSVILNTEITNGTRESGLDDAQAVCVLQKEVKKRKDAIDLYNKTGNPQRAQAEQYEIDVIENYLPKQLSEDQIRMIVEEEIESLNQPFTQQQMGVVIGSVKKRAEGAADGALIARIVREKL